MLMIILGAVVLIVFTVLLFLAYSGYFYKHTIRLSEHVSVPRRFAYKVHIGPYENVGPLFKELCTFVPHLTLFGVYYDDPNEVQNDKLRAIVGCYLPENSKDKFEDSLVKAGYEIETFPECTKALITEFPYRNMLSILIAVKRVYPSLMEYIKESSNEIKHFGPFMELYKKRLIEFVVVFEPNEGFSVSRLPPPPEKNKETRKTQ